MNDLFGHRETFAVIIPDNGRNKQQVMKFKKYLNSLPLIPDIIIRENFTATSKMGDVRLRIQNAIHRLKAYPVPVDFVFVMDAEKEYPKNYFNVMKFTDLDYIWVEGCNSYSCLGFRLSMIKGFDWPWLTDNSLGSRLIAYGRNFRFKEYSINFKTIEV